MNFFQKILSTNGQRTFSEKIKFPTEICWMVWHNFYLSFYLCLAINFLTVARMWANESRNLNSYMNFLWEKFEFQNCHNHGYLKVYQHTGFKNRRHYVTTKWFDNSPFYLSFAPLNNNVKSNMSKINLNPIIGSTNFATS